MFNGKNKKGNGFGHGGNLVDLGAKAGTDPKQILDFSANINPLGPPEYLRKIISRGVNDLVNYPDPHCRELMASLSSTLGIDEQQLFLANGSTEIIYALPRALPCKRVIIPAPSYLDYERAAQLAGLESVQVSLLEEDGFCINFERLATLLKPGDLVLLGRPNNPTGISFDSEGLLELTTRYPEVYFSIDESFFEFVDETSDLITTNMATNLVVFRSLTKFYAIPGLRLGFGAASPTLANNIKQHLLPWTVNSLAQAIGKKMLPDKEYGELSRRYVKERREELQEKLSSISCLHVFPADANYLLVKLEKPGMTAQLLADRLLKSPEPIAIRTCSNFVGLDENYFRVAVRTEKDNEKLFSVLANELEPSGISTIKIRKKTPALMLQGTSSNAGKSVLTAALGRIFLQDGYRVAPFKAQNMSLNSFVTRDGKEMGRAQVVQAQACLLDPDVRMNPVLLKPSSDIGSQVIVNGEAVGNMSVSDYIRFKPDAKQAAFDAYDSLAAKNDIMVLEGAGSPAEVNLKHHDIVNMSMARHAESPVLLVGDIDRGGIFASFIGTMEVMAEWERSLVAGFIVNRFRGQASLLNDAFRYVEEFTGKNVFGTVPYIHDHGLPEEDSVSFKEGLYEKNRPDGEHIEIGVIDLPHISNFTDVEPFLAEPDVHLQIIRNKEDMDIISQNLAALILPGSKNVINDLAFLKNSGLAKGICELAAVGTLNVFGICGGFQMLGKEITDPFRIESEGGDITGLGILDVKTTLAEEKTLVRQTGLHLPSKKKIHGYEIHHGQTVAHHKNILQFNDGSEGGAISADGRIWGCYLHGIFDKDDFRRWFIDSLRSSRNMKPLGKIMAPYDLEPAFDRLADIVRESLDMNKIYRQLGLK